MNNVRCLTTVVLALSLCLAAGCDPQKVVKKYYAELGLNPLSILRDDIEPGAVFLSYKRKGIAAYADNMLDYATETKQQYSVSIDNAMKHFNAVLPSLEHKRKVKPNLALKFLDAILPVNVTGSIEFTSNVTIAPVQAKAKRMKLFVIQRYLDSPDSAPFRRQMKNLQQKKSES